MRWEETMELLKSKALCDFTSGEMEGARELAITILRADYYRDVRDTVASILSAIKDKEVTDREGLMDRIHEECDGDQRVIYTHLNKETLLFSDNSGACVEDFGEEGLVKDGDVNWAAMAFCAFERDVIEGLESEDVDVNNFEVEEEEETPTEPDDDDLITEDFVNFFVFEQGHKGPVLVVPEGEDWQNLAAAYMKAEGFYPNVWLQEERGGYTLLLCEDKD